jgi:hypothetical protein
MDIVNWLYLKKAELIRDTISSPEDLVLLGADVSFDKRGDKYLTYAVPVSLIGGAGSGITLKTNGTNNTVQTILNLVEGNNIELTDNGDGSVIIATFGNELVDADSGLNIGAPGVVYLGGTLLETTTIDVTSQYQLNITGANNQNKGEVLFVENTSTDEDVVALNSKCDGGVAIVATSVTGLGIQCLVTGSGGGIFSSSAGSHGLTAVSASTNAGNDSRPIYAYGSTVSKPSLFEVKASTSGVPDATQTSAIVLRKRGDTPLVGFGPFIQFETRDVTPGDQNYITSSTIASVYVDTTLGSESTALEFSVQDTGTLTKVLVMESSGIFTLTQGLGDYIDDAAAQAGGVPINGLYRTASNVKIRVS